MRLNRVAWEGGGIDGRICKRRVARGRGDAQEFDRTEESSMTPDLRLVIRSFTHAARRTDQLDGAVPCHLVPPPPPPATTDPSYPSRPSQPHVTFTKDHTEARNGGLVFEVHDGRVDHF